MTPPQDVSHVLVLTGPMGAGKTAIGRLLAAELGRPFVDSDAEIESETQQTIAEIFATEGEPHFRKLERDICVRLIDQRDPPLVIALGGGAFMQDDIRTASLQDHVRSIYLHASPESSWSRIKNAHVPDRPLLAHPAPIQTLQNLYHQRDPFYRHAHLFVDTDDRQPHDIVEQILSRLGVPISLKQ